MTWVDAFFVKLAALRVDPKSLARLLAAKTKELTRAMPELKKGHRNLTRAEMPQLDAAALKRFLAELRKSGIRVLEYQVRASALKPSQKHLDTEKTKKLAALYLEGKLDTAPLLIAEDRTIADGHHRWAAVRSVNPAALIKVCKVGLPFARLVSRAKAFDGVKFKGLNGKAA